MRILLLLFFFLSGACGLIYEVVWTKLLVLVIGSTTYSITTVLVAFMGGLALGSYLGGRLIDRRGDPLLTYGIIEGLVGLYCLIIPFLIHLTEPLFAYFYNHYYTDQFYIFSLARFLVSALILLVPTTMMGATLPVLSRYFVHQRDKFGWGVGRLYAINTFGAVAGSFGCGFVLLPLLGKWHTILAAAAANLLIFFLVIIYRFLIKRGSSREELAINEMPPEEETVTKDVSGLTISPKIVWAVLFTYAANGFAGMAYQIAWTRAISLSIGSSAYAFSLVLTVFIAGLAFGAAVGARLADRIKNPVMIFGWIEVLIGFFALIVIAGLGRLPIWIVPVIVRYSFSYNTLFAVLFGIVFALLFIPTALMGTAFPLAVRIVSLGKSGIGRPVGLAYGWNTGGAILGSFIAGFVFIPLVGLQRTINIGNGINWAFGALLLALGWNVFKGKREWLKWPVALIPALVGLVATALMPVWDIGILDSGPFVYAQVYKDSEQDSGLPYADAMKDMDTLFHKEGVDTNVAVLKTKDDPILVLRVNGKTDASTSADMMTQIFVAHVPMLLYGGAAPKVLVIGLASGMTAGTVTVYPAKSLDIVEISGAVVEASAYFDKFNHNVLKDPRVRLIVGDGRNHLLLTDRKYDVIISEPSNPWLAGLSNLFTREYISSARDHLTENGIFCMWLQSYRMRPEEFEMIIRTFKSVFPDATVWQSIPGVDYILVGSKGSIRLSLADVMRRMDDPKVKEDLKNIGMDDPLRFFSSMIFSAGAIEELCGGGEIHTDDRLQLEYRAPKSLYTDTFVDLYKTLLRFAENPADGLFQQPDELSADFKEKLANEVKARDMFLQAKFQEVVGQPANARDLYTKYLEIKPNDGLGKSSLYSLLKGMGAALANAKRYDQALEVYAQAAKLRPESSSIDDRIGVIYLMTDKKKEAREAFESAVKKNPDDTVAIFNLGYIEFQDKNIGEAENYFEKAHKLSPNYAEALHGMALVAYSLGRKNKAVDYFEQAIKLKPGYADAHKNLGLVLVKSNVDVSEGLKHLKLALKLDPQMPDKKQVEDIINKTEHPDVKEK